MGNIIHHRVLRCLKKFEMYENKKKTNEIEYA